MWTRAKAGQKAKDMAYLARFYWGRLLSTCGCWVGPCTDRSSVAQRCQRQGVMPTHRSMANGQQVMASWWSCRI